LCKRRRRLLEKAFASKRNLFVEQRLQIRCQRRVLLAEARQPVEASVRGHVEHLVEIRADGVPPLGVELAHRLLRQRLLPQRSMKVDAGLFPVALDRPLRDAAHRGDFSEREPAEEFQIDDLRESRVDTREIVERVADLRELAFVRDHLGDFGAQRGDLESPSTLLSAAIARVLDDQAPHRPSGITHELRPIRERQPIPARDIEIGFVEKGGDAEARTGARPGKLAPCEAMQFRIERGEQRLRRGVGP
jgi:hypothetical protein